MEPFRKHVAIAIDGGGIRGIMVTKALSMLENHLHLPIHDIFRLATGTSTGAIIAAGIGAGLTARELTGLYEELGPAVFPKTWRKAFFPLSRYRYPGEPLRDHLNAYFGSRKMGDFWRARPQTDVVITTFDLASNHTCFVKPWKKEYEDWPITLAVQGSCTVPTYFPVVEDRYIDGGVGSYANPCYLAAYEAKYFLQWRPEETTLLSFGTGRDPHHFQTEKSNQLQAWDWINPMFNAFLSSAADQQVHLVDTFFPELDFRRFQVDLTEPIDMDDIRQVPRLLRYGEEMGSKLLANELDRAQKITVKSIAESTGVTNPAE